MPETPKDALRSILKNGGCDLHLHTSASDGTASPKELVRLVCERGLRAFSVTDHDTVAAIPDIEDALLSTPGSAGVRFVPGVELSTALQEEDRVTEVHLLGYFPLGGIEQIEKDLIEMRNRRHNRNERMCRRLTELGMPVSMDELAAESASRTSGKVVGRVQAANILVRKGFADNRRDAFHRFLSPGRPGYVDRERLTLQDAILLLKRSGGVSVVAHPHVYGWTNPKRVSDLGALLAGLAKAGLDGVEAFHGEADDAARRQIAAAGMAVGLLLTCGSDWHGNNRHATMYDAKEDFSRYLPGQS